MTKTKTLKKLYKRTKRGIKTLHLKTMSKKQKIAELKTLSKNGLLDLIILICEMLKKNIHNPHTKNTDKFFSEEFKHYDKFGRDISQVKAGFYEPGGVLYRGWMSRLKQRAKEGYPEYVRKLKSEKKKIKKNPHKGTVKVKGKTKYLNNQAGKKKQLNVFKKMARANVKKKRWSQKTATAAIKKLKKH